MRKIAIGLLLACTAGAASAEEVKLNGRSFMEAAVQLKPGQYIWAPERAPSGPSLVVVNLATQRLAMFRGGMPIGASTSSLNTFIIAAPSAPSIAR